MIELKSILINKGVLGDSKVEILMKYNKFLSQGYTSDLTRNSEWNGILFTIADKNRLIFYESELSSIMYLLKTQVGNNRYA